MFFAPIRKNIFISHAWNYNHDYCTIIEWLDRSPILYHNYSVPRHDPVDANNTLKLKKALTEQIKHASIVIIIAGMYASYSNWIQYEIDEAVRMGKKIIAIKPRGNERLPLAIQMAAHKTVNWNSTSLVDAVKEI